MFRSRQRLCQTELVNCRPRSLVIVDGTPKRWIHPERRACAQSAAVVEVSGTASGHLVVRSITVNKWVNQDNCGSGQTRSTCR
jgi:hypothetical protein